MPFNREARRTFAQFLNGIAVATTITGVVAPMMAGSATWRTMMAAAIIAAALHGLALAITNWQ